MHLTMSLKVIYSNIHSIVPHLTHKTINHLQRNSGAIS